MSASTDFEIVRPDPAAEWEPVVIASLPKTFGEPMEVVMERAHEKAREGGLYPRSSLALGMLTLAAAGKFRISPEVPYIVYPA